MHSGASQSSVHVQLKRPMIPSLRTMRILGACLLLAGCGGGDDDAGGIPAPTS
jgi:hypothetical protein